MFTNRLDHQKSIQQIHFYGSDKHQITYALIGDWSQAGADPGGRVHGGKGVKWVSSNSPLLNALYVHNTITIGDGVPLLSSHPPCLSIVLVPTASHLEKFLYACK